MSVKLKAKDLIKILEEYPDFDIILTADVPKADSNSATFDSPWPSYIHYGIDGLDDIGHSSRELHFGISRRD